MKCAARISVLLLAILTTATQPAPADGPGGGHGGSDGHGSSGHSGSGGHGGHAGGRSSVGPSSSHSFGHAIAHMFGHRTKESLRSPMMSQRKPKSPAFTRPVRFFPLHRRFGFSSCTNFGFFPRHFGFAGGFNRFDDGILFDPFLLGGFSVLGSVPEPIDTDQPRDSGLSNDLDSDQQVTLLQLLDGSMYGLTSYHVAGHELHYTTDYGAQNSVPLDRIDFTQTLRLNAERHVPFVLEPKPSPH